VTCGIKNEGDIVIKNGTQMLCITFPIKQTAEVQANGL